MNKTLLSLVIFILVACTSPQTSEVSAIPPPTQTFIPTPTLHPEFIELQNLSERFFLLPDGNLEEITAEGGRRTVPNLHVDENGIITILVDGKTLVVDRIDITFDDENGITINGYEQDENGEWVQAGNKVLINGVAFALSDEVDVNGFSVVTE